MDSFEKKFPTLHKRKLLVDKKRTTQELAEIRRAKRKMVKERHSNKPGAEAQYAPQFKKYKKCDCGSLLRPTDSGQYWCQGCRNFYKAGGKAC